MKVRYVPDADQETVRMQVQWGGNDDPRGVLTEGAVYHVRSIEEHSFHTKYCLEEYPRYRFNSAHFAPLD